MERAERGEPLAEERFFRTLLDNLYDGVYFVDGDREITYWNKTAERITGYAPHEMLGKRCHDNLLRHIDESGVSLCQSQCPLIKSMTARRSVEADVYLHHKLGHQVPVSIRVTPIEDAQGNIVGAVELFSDNSAKTNMRQRIEELETLALVDSLTRLPNRRYLEINLRNALEEMHRYGWPMGVLFLDIDRFKQINDRYGHPAGDEVLRTLGKTLMNNARPFDAVGRWGGEEFLGVIRNIDAKRLYVIAERFRFLVEHSSISSGAETIHFTVSIGGTVAREGDTIESLVERADRRMYESKQAGRNRVTVDPESDERKAPFPPSGGPAM
jgi:diguanylate cyclase (GGDEF)-like protein/PAS domain S-box-containing protein